MEEKDIYECMKNIKGIIDEKEIALTKSLFKIYEDTRANAVPEGMYLASLKTRCDCDNCYSWANSFFCNNQEIIMTFKKKQTRREK